MSEQVFKDLREARQIAWREVCNLDGVMTSLKGDLSALEALTLTLDERHALTLGPTATGLYHCASRALATFKELEEVHDRIGEAVLVTRDNDPSRLSGEAVRSAFQRGPHGGGEATHG